MQIWRYTMCANKKERKIYRGSQVIHVYRYPIYRNPNDRHDSTRNVYIYIYGRLKVTIKFSTNYVLTGTVLISAPSTK